MEVEMRQMYNLSLLSVTYFKESIDVHVYMNKGYQEGYFSAL